MLERLGGTMSMRDEPQGFFREPDQSLRDRGALGPADTHRIAEWPEHRLIAHSGGLGWRDCYVSLATEAPWATRLDPVGHLAMAYCTNRSAAVTRATDGDRTLHRVHLRPRLFGLIPADRSSTWQVSGRPDVALVYLRRSMVQEVADELGTGRIDVVPRLGFHDPLLEQVVLTLLDGARHRDATMRGLYVDQLARTLAAHLLRAHGTAGPPRRRSGPTAPAPAAIGRVVDLVESALDEELTLTRLAAEAGMGTHAFAAAFTRATGTAPHRYVTGRRVERAKVLLRTTDRPLAEVALATGFATQSHFTTVFRRAVGIPPGAYRRA